MACNNAICVWIWEHYTLIIRLWGVITAVATWAIGIDLCTSAEPWVGAYLIFIALVVTMLEGTFIFGSCLDRCCNPGNCCGKLWFFLKWFTNWKRGLLYIVLSIVIWIVPGLNYICAIMVDVLGVMYGCRSWKNKDPKSDNSEKNKEFHDVTAANEQPIKSARGTGSYDDDTDPLGDAGVSRYP